MSNAIEEVEQSVGLIILLGVLFVFLTLAQKFGFLGGGGSSAVAPAAPPQPDQPRKSLWYLPAPGEPWNDGQGHLGDLWSWIKEKLGFQAESTIAAAPPDGTKVQDYSQLADTLENGGLAGPLPGPSPLDELTAEYLQGQG